MELNLALQALGILGLLISLYFLAVYKGWIKGNEKFLPKAICSSNACHEILRTGFAAVFRVPNFVLGIFYYIVVIASTFLSLSFNLFYMLLVLSWLVMTFSLYLAYALMFELRASCTLCFASHLINICIAIIFFMQSFGY